MIDKRVHFKGGVLPYVFLLPQVAVTVIFFLYPAGMAIEEAFYTQDAFGIHPPTFVGLTHFTALFNDRGYLDSFLRTVFFSASVMLLSMGVALLLAAVADYLFKQSRLYRTLLIIPYAVAPVLAGVLWLFLFNPTLGIVAERLQALGIDWNQKVHGVQAMALIILAAAWNHLSYNFLFFFAAMQSIPRSLIEACAIDGAGPVRRFFDLIFPLLSPTTFFLVVTNLIYAFFETFPLIDAVTQGGPGESTTTLVYKVFQDGYVGHRYGASAAQSVVLITIVSLLTFVQFRFVERKVSYAG